MIDILEESNGKVVITGGSGHVGANLVRKLISYGIYPKVLIRSDRRAVEGLNVEVASGDILDFPFLLDAFEGASIVFHLAAFISIRGGQDGRVRQVNIEGTKNVVEACLACGVKKLIHFSSIHALSQFPKYKPIDETNLPATPQLCHEYDWTKAESEKEVLKGVLKGLDAVILNPTGIIGPFDFKPSYLGKFILSLIKGNCPALIQGGFDWVDVRDVVDGAISAVRMGRRGERYILSGHYASVSELADMICNISGARRPRFVAPIWLAKLGAPVVSFLYEIFNKESVYTMESVRALEWNKNIICKKAETELDYKRRPIEETLEDTYRWFRDAKMV